jgi:Fe-S-cluster containining protein
MTKQLPPGSPCSNCGKCCTNTSYMGTLQADGEDVKRWEREGRDDILRYVSVLGPDENPWGDLWVDSENDFVEKLRCPFVRKVRNSNRYLCSIHETRPQVCRDYVPWEPGNLCETVTEPKPKDTKRGRR